MFVTGLLLSAESSFYILDTSPLSDICFADIFYKSVACLFIFVIVSLEEQKIFILILFNLPIFYAWPFLYPGAEFEPRSVGSKVRPFVTFSIMFPQKSILRPVPGRHPQELPRERAENTESWVPTLGDLLQWPGQTWECVYVTTPQVTV